MIDRVNKVLIGKSVSRTAALTAATLYTGTNGPAEGEIIVLDKNFKLATPGITIADTDTIYIAEGTGSTYTHTNEAGTAVTGVRKLIVSDPIEAKNVTSYLGRSYSAVVQQVVTITPSLTPVVGTEYTLRVVYTDSYERPGQIAVTYRVTCTTATVANLITLFTAAINGHATRRINATDGTSYLTLTARAMPYDVTDSVNAIDEFYMVNFKVVLLSNNYTTATTVVYTTAPFPGNGTWQRVRDAEKKAQSYKGIMNRTVFPVITPAMRTVVSTNYDTIVIEHNKSYYSPDSYNKTTRVTTELYIVDGASQTADVLAVLNPWMASCPGRFDSITSL
jgi:hypothetical protein